MPVHDTLPWYGLPRIIWINTLWGKLKPRLEGPKPLGRRRDAQLLNEGVQLVPVDDCQTGRPHLVEQPDHYC